MRFLTLSQLMWWKALPPPPKKSEWQLPPSVNKNERLKTRLESDFTEATEHRTCPEFIIRSSRSIASAGGGSQAIFCSWPAAHSQGLIFLSVLLAHCGVFLTFPWLRLNLRLARRIPELNSKVGAFMQPALMRRRWALY